MPPLHCQSPATAEIAHAADAAEQRHAHPHRGRQRNYGSISSDPAATPAARTNSLHVSSGFERTMTTTVRSAQEVERACCDGRPSDRQFNCVACPKPAGTSRSVEHHENVVLSVAIR